MYSIENREYHVIKGVIMLLLNQALFHCLVIVSLILKLHENSIGIYLNDKNMKLPDVNPIFAL